MMSSLPHDCLNIAVIGAGAFGSRRARSIASLAQEGLCLKYVVDSDVARARSLAEALGCSWRPSWEELLREDGLDAVVVATPNSFKAEIVSRLAEAGLHVLCEKPFMLNAKDAERLSKRHPGTVIKTGSKHRYFPHIAKAKELFDSGCIGTPSFARGVIGNSGTHLDGSWMTVHELSGGGSFIDNGCHLLDLACWFLGEPLDCKGYIIERPSAAGIEDSGMALYRMQSGIVVSIQSSWMEWNGYMAFEIYGDQGFISVDARGKRCQVATGGRKGVEHVFDFSDQVFRSLELELLHFAAMARGASQVTPNAWDGYRVVRMATALYESAKTSQVVLI